ncbi:hypothetical protein ACFQT0_05215 [Hymenobacter humi]|uniref:Uncharacterized protein n=1 Tax=Hymenobacter humi TaxID=1411620 RepID=A0ABW2U1S8_9BACT
MGAQQAFQWAVSYPAFADRIVATSGTAKTYPHGVVRLEGQIAALTADAAFQNGEYTTPPTKGLEAFATVWTAWLYSQEWWRRELWRATAKPGTTFEQAAARVPNQLHPRRRCQRPDSTDVHLGAARRGHHAGLRRRRGKGPARHQNADIVHAFGNRLVLSAHRRTL